MRTHLLAAAVAAAMVVLPNRSAAQADVHLTPRSDSAALVVDRLLTHGRELSLSERQVGQLTALAQRLRYGKGRLQIVDFDRVPGKAVPRIKRVWPSAKDAFSSAKRYLTPEQVRAAAALSDTPDKEPSHNVHRSSAATIKCDLARIAGIREFAHQTVALVGDSQ